MPQKLPDEKMIEQQFNNQPEHKTMVMRIRDFLETYKVFFEIFSSILLAIMSIIISIISVQINKRDMDTNKRELEILDESREPYFDLFWKSQFDDGVFDIVIRNNGGMLRDAWLDVIYIQEYSVLDYASFGIKVDNYDPFFRYRYDEETKEFVIHYDPHVNDVNKICSNVQEELGLLFFTNDQFRVQIHYTNYKNERKDIEYEILENSLTLVEENKEFNCDYLFVYNTLFQSVDDMTQKIVDTLIEEN